MMQILLDRLMEKSHTVVMNFLNLFLKGLVHILDNMMFTMER